MQTDLQPGPPRPATQAGSTRNTVLSVVAAVCVWIGILVFLYPTAASWLSQANQSKVLQNYETAVQSANPSRDEQLANAREYNAALTAGALLEVGGHVPTSTATVGPGVLPYQEQLRANQSGLMGRLRIPSIDLDLPIYHGTGDETLLRGLGHLEGTSLPVGGSGTRSVITGHRGLASATMFTHLDQVEVGDIFSLEIFGETLTYRAIEQKIVEPDEQEALQEEPGRDLVTLVTCTPLGINTHRILLTGERILPTPPEEEAKMGADPTVPHFPWWAVGAGAATLICGGYTVFATRSAIKARRQ